MSKAWCACLTVETVSPRETSSGSNAASNVVLPLPLQPASPNIRIVARSLQAELGRRDGGRNAPPTPNARICADRLRARAADAPYEAVRTAGNHTRSPGSGE